MRDRLRNLYLLKKAKQNGHPTNDTTKHKQKESNVHRPIPVHSPIQVSQSSDKFGMYIMCYYLFVCKLINVLSQLYNMHLLI